MVYPHVKYLGPVTPGPLKRGKSAMIRELDSRLSDGIYVRPLWHPDNGQVSIAVDDAKTGEAFELVVRDEERALDVYHHPFVYAAERRHGNETSATRLAVGRVEG